MNVASLSPRSKLLLCLAIVYLIWGSSYLATRIGVHELPPFLFGGVRFIISGMLLYAVARWLGQARAPLSGNEWRHLAVVGFCTVLLSNGFNVWAMQWVPSNQSALLNASSAFWIALLGTLGRRAHPITLGVGTGLTIGFAGTALVLWPGAGAATVGSAMGAASAAVTVATSSLPPAVPPPSPYGALIPELSILAGCFGWALGTIYLRNVRTNLDLLTFTALQMLCGGVMLTGVAIAVGELGRWRWSGPGLVAMAYMTLFSSCIAYVAYGWLSKHATPAQVGTYGFVNPAIATLLGWLVLGETLSTTQLAGMAVILLGVLLVNGTRAQSRSSSRE